MKDTHFVHHAYEPPEVIGVKCPTKEDQTQQHFLIDSDINHIMKKFAETGMIGDPLRPATRQPQYGDFSTTPTFQEAQQAIIDADSAFAGLPANIQLRFHHSISEYLSFIDNPENIEEGIKLGIFERKKPPEKPAEKPAEKPPEKRGRVIKKITQTELIEPEELIV